MSLRAFYLEYKRPWHSPAPSVTLLPTKESLCFLIQHCFICLVAQLCPTLLWPHGLSRQGSSVHGIFQARILEWAAISFCRGSSHPRDGTWVSCRVSCIAGRFFTTSTTGKALTEYSSLQLGILPAPTTTAPCSALSTLVIAKGLWFPMNPHVVQCLCVFVYGDISAWNSLHSCLHLDNTSPFFLIHFFYRGTIGL